MSTSCNLSLIEAELASVLRAAFSSLLQALELANMLNVSNSLTMHVFTYCVHVCEDEG